VLALGGERSKEEATTQILKLRLTPVLFDEQGNQMPEGEQFISDRDDERDDDRDAADEPAHELE
jgi:hypothetical protein